MSIHHIKQIVVAALALAQPLAFTSIAHAADGSQDASMGAVSIVASPLASIEGHPLAGSALAAYGAGLVVVGIGAAIGETVSVIVQNTVDGSKAVVRTTTSVLKEIGLSTGSAIQVVAGSTGYTLMASGKILAFVPNELGKELLYQSRLSK